MSESAPGFASHPEYRVDITPTTQRIRALVDGVPIADTRQALEVVESRHHPVWYIPLADVDEATIQATDHTTYCPFKGHASYWSILVAGRTLENTVWGYRTPYTECAPLKDHVAFYTDRVALEIDGAPQPAQGPGWTDR
jgi:uncharacterized protein (DUF427 family)